MSNRVAIQYTRFINLDDNGNEVKNHLGYRIYDDYGQDYNNCFDSREELKTTINPQNAVEYVRANHDQFYESIIEKQGFYFNEKWYVYEGDSKEEKIDDPIWSTPKTNCPECKLLWAIFNTPPIEEPHEHKQKGGK